MACGACSICVHGTHTCSKCLNCVTCSVNAQPDLARWVERAINLPINRPRARLTETPTPETAEVRTTTIATRATTTTASSSVTTRTAGSVHGTVWDHGVLRRSDTAYSEDSIVPESTSRLRSRSPRRRRLVIIDLTESATESDSQ